MKYEELTIVECPSPAWIPIALLIQEEYRASGAKVFISSNDNLSEVLECQGMEASFISKDSLIDNLSLIREYNIINIVMHHHRQSVSCIDFINHCMSVRKVKISFFCDGFNNVFPQRQYVGPFCDRLLSQGVLRGDVISMGSNEVDIPQYLARFNRLAISNRNLPDILGLPYAQMKVNHWIQNNSERLNGHQDIFIILMRPWGSKSFQGGRLDLAGGHTKPIVNILINTLLTVSEHIGVPLEEAPILFREDLRCAETAASIRTELLNSALLSNLIFVDKWSLFLSFDYFLWCLASSKLFSTINVVSLDSTIPLIFQGLSKNITFFVGATEESVHASSTNDTAMKFIKTKIASLRSLLIRNSINTKVTDLDPMLFMLGNTKPNDFNKA